MTATDRKKSIEVAPHPPNEDQADPGARASRPLDENQAVQAAETLAVPATSISISAKSHPGWHSRGYLPHFDRPGLVQSITFRLHDALPRSVIEAWAGSYDAEKRRRAEAH